MTARKTHLALKFNSDVLCGDKPRENAAPLVTTITTSEVTCAKCLNAIADIDTMPVETIDDFKLDPKILDLSDRYDLDYDTVQSAIANGWLKI